MSKERKQNRDAQGSVLKKVVERSTSAGRTRTETIYYARVRVCEYDEAGNFVRVHERKRRAANFNAASSLRQTLRVELEEEISGSKRRKPEERKFLYDLLDYYKTNYVKEAVFVGGKKISGQRNPVRNTLRMLDSIREFFGNVPVAAIDYSMLFEYKEFLLATPFRVERKVLIPPEDLHTARKYTKTTTRHRQTFGHYEELRTRKPATVHRYLACLRRVLSVGVQHGWAAANPFRQGDPLIETSVEEVRDRNCSYEEEYQLLQQCSGSREHLRDVIICAIDTFLRESELFSLRGSDVNFEGRYLSVREMNAKTLKTRTVPLSDRAHAAFLRLRGDRSTDEWNGSRVFEFKSVNNAWYTALTKAGIENLRFHDLRGTGITRMLDAGVPEAIVMKFSGHEKYETFKKYVKSDLRIINNAADAMSRVFRENQMQFPKGHMPLGSNTETSGNGLNEVMDETKSVN